MIKVNKFWRRCGERGVLITVGGPGGLNENGPYRLIYLNVWLLLSGTVWEGRIRRCDLARRGVSLGSDVSTQLLLQFHACLPAAMLPTMMTAD